MLLDPCHKERLLKYYFFILFGKNKANELIVEVRNTLNSLYDHDKLLYSDHVLIMDEVHNGHEIEIDTDEIDAKKLFDSGYKKL